MSRRMLAVLSMVVLCLVTAGCCEKPVLPLLGWAYTPEEDSIYGVTVSKTADGGYIVGGGHNSSYDMYALKLDGTGAKQWDRVYSNLSAGGSHGELWRHEARGLAQTADGGYMMLGAGKNDGDGMPDKSFLLVNLDATGGIYWSKTYAPQNPYSAGNMCVNNEPGVLVPTADGGWFVAGSSYVGQYDLASALKTDAQGNMEFIQVVNDNARAYSQEIVAGQQTADGGYVLCGYSDNGSPHGYLALLIKLDALGNLVFSKTFQYTQGGYGAEAYAVTQTADGGYVFGGVLVNDITKALIHGPWMAKLDGNGDLLWSSAYADDSTLRAPKAIKETPQGDILAAGSNNVGAMMVAKFTGAGVPLWDYAVPEDLPDATANDMVLTADGGCVMVGSGISSGMLVAKVNNVFGVD